MVVNEQAARIQFAIAGDYCDELFAGAHVNYFLALIQPPQILPNLMQVLYVLISILLLPEHEFLRLASEPQSIIPSQDDSAELPMDYLHDVL